MGQLTDDRYLRWQNAFAEAFLADQSGALVFFVDDEELRHIAPDLDDPAADLALAVRDTSSSTPGAYFSRVDRQHRLWKLGNRSTPPPTLPVLALTVLAATRMHSDQHALSTNYYWRLAESIHPEAGQMQLIELRDEVAGPAFQDIVDMWRSLDEWVTSQCGRVGTSTIRTHERLTRVGYPQSQALLTRADRAQLTSFFTAFNLSQTRLPDHRTLLQALDVWTTRTQNRLSETFMAGLRDENMRGLIAVVVLAFASAWDGFVITREGRRRIGIRLGIDLEEWLTEWLFPVQHGVESPLVLDGITSSAEPVSLTHNPPYAYYVAEHCPPVTPELVRQGWHLRGRHFAAEFPKAQVLIFAEDAQTGAWSTTAGITPFETHVIAAISSESAAVARVLERAAEEGWTPRRQGANALLPGFSLFQDVRFKNDEALRAALDQEPGLRRLGLAPTLVPRARFVRGLPLDRGLAPNHYLLGGEPDILLPTPEAPDTIVLSLNGVEDLLPTNGFPFEVRRLGYPEGDIDVIADGQSLRFTLRGESAIDATPPGTGALGWSERGAITTSMETARIVGAVASGPTDASVVLARRGRDETWLLLDGGEATRCIEPGMPTFAQGAGLSFEPAYFEVRINRSAQWLAQRTGSNWQLSKLAPGAPRAVKASFDVLGTWERTCEASGTAFWTLQLGMANG